MNPLTPTGRLGSRLGERIAGRRRPELAALPLGRRLKVLDVFFVGRVTSSFRAHRIARNMLYRLAVVHFCAKQRQPLRRSRLLAGAQPRIQTVQHFTRPINPIELFAPMTQGGHSHCPFFDGNRLIARSAFGLPDGSRTATRRKPRGGGGWEEKSGLANSKRAVDLLPQRSTGCELVAHAGVHSKVGGTPSITRGKPTQRRRRSSRPSELFSSCTPTSNSLVRSGKADLNRQEIAAFSFNQSNP